MSGPHSGKQDNQCQESQETKFIYSVYYLLFHGCFATFTEIGRRKLSVGYCSDIPHVMKWYQQMFGATTVEMKVTNVSRCVFSCKCVSSVQSAR